MGAAILLLRRTQLGAGIGFDDVYIHSVSPVEIRQGPNIGIVLDGRWRVFRYFGIKRVAKSLSVKALDFLGGTDPVSPKMGRRQYIGGVYPFDIGAAAVIGDERKDSFRHV
jgi:hypothetical protein